MLTTALKSAVDLQVEWKPLKPLNLPVRFWVCLVANLTPCGFPSLLGYRSVSQNNTPASINLGFLTVLQDASGWLGGYLVTNSWGRPLEFRLTTAVQPNKIQTTLYGPTLTEYILADLIGKTLVEKTGTKPDLIVTDTLELLRLRSRIEIPAIAIRPQNANSELVRLDHPRTAAGLVLPAQYSGDQQKLISLLDRVDTAVDLSEPFLRIREAIAESRKMGVNNRAA